MAAGMRTWPAPVKLTALLAALVTVAAWVLSYEALAEGARAIGIRPELSWLYPVVVDGVVATAYVATFALRDAHARTRLYVWTIMLGAIALSVTGNGFHAVLHAGSLGLPLAVAIPGSAIPALSLACVIHLHVVLARVELREATGQPQAQPRQVALQRVAQVERSAGRTEDRYRALAAEARARGEHLSDRAAATELGVSRQRIATLRQRMAGEPEERGVLSVMGGNQMPSWQGR